MLRFGRFCFWYCSHFFINWSCIVSDFGKVAIVPHVRIVVLQQRGAKRINLRKPSGPPPERTPRDGSSFDARAHRAVDHSAAPRIRLAGLESQPQRDRRNVEDSVRERNVRDKETYGLTQFQVAHELPNRPGVIEIGRASRWGRVYMPV